MHLGLGFGIGAALLIAGAAALAFVDLRTERPPHRNEVSVRAIPGGLQLAF